MSGSICAAMANAKAIVTMTATMALSSPAGGRLAVDLILGRRREAENPFGLARFSKGTTPGKSPL